MVTVGNRMILQIEPQHCRRTAPLTGYPVYTEISGEVCFA